MLHRIKSVFINQLKAVDWMDPVTKGRALVKAERMAINLGSPPQYRLTNYPVDPSRSLSLLLDPSAPLSLLLDPSTSRPHVSGLVFIGSSSDRFRVWGFGLRCSSHLI